MFSLEDLKLLSVTKFQKKLNATTRSNSFIDCVRELYTCTHKGNPAMRSAVVEVVAHQRKTLDGIELESLFRNGGDFVVDYLEALEQTLK